MRYLLILLIFTGCYTSKTATRQVIKAHAHYPEVIASFCGNTFPPIEFTKDSFIYKQGETVYEYDTIKVDCDTVTNTLTRVVKIPVTTLKVRIDTVYMSKSVQVANKAKEYDLQSRLDKANIELAKHKQLTSWLMWATIILAALDIIYLVYRFWIKK